MTEFEMVSAMQGATNIGMTILMNFFTVVTAYLAAGYLAAHKLTRAMAAFVTAAFLVLAVLFLVGVYRGMVMQSAMLAEMVNFAKAGKGLAWHPFVSVNASSESSGFFIGALLLAIMIAGIVGSVYFFYDCRKRNLIGAA